MKRRRRGPGHVRRRVAAARSVRDEEQGSGRWSGGSTTARSPALLPATRGQPPTSARAGARRPFSPLRWLLGPPRSWGQGARGSVGLGSLIHSFSADGSPDPLCSGERREEGAAANEGPGASRAPLCSAAGGGKGLREVGSGPLPQLPGVCCAPSLLPAWKWLRLFSSGE